MSVDAGQLVLSSPVSSSPRWVKQQFEFAKQAQNPDQGPKLDLGFKEGQTIKLNIAVSPNPAWLYWPRSDDTCGHHTAPSPEPIPLSQFSPVSPADAHCASYYMGVKERALLSSRVEMGKSRCDYNMAGGFCDLGVSSVP